MDAIVGLGLVSDIVGLLGVAISVGKWIHGKRSLEKKNFDCWNDALLKTAELREWKLQPVSISPTVENVESFYSTEELHSWLASAFNVSRQEITDDVVSFWLGCYFRKMLCYPDLACYLDLSQGNLALEQLAELSKLVSEVKKALDEQPQGQAQEARFVGAQRVKDNHGNIIGRNEGGIHIHYESAKS